MKKKFTIKNSILEQSRKITFQRQTPGVIAADSEGPIDPIFLLQLMQVIPEILLRQAEKEGTLNDDVYADLYITCHTLINTAFDSDNLQKFCKSREDASRKMNGTLKV